MANDKRFEELRKKAEEIFKSEGSKVTKETEKSLDKLLEELNIYQIELEMQNKELQKTGQTLEREKEKYRDLYMNAPVAYLTLNDTGNIIELNQEAADMLGLPIYKFKYTSIFPYLEEDSKVKFNKLFKEVKTETEISTGELIFSETENKSYTHCRIDIKAFYDYETESPLFRCTLIDIGAQYQAAYINALNEAKFVLLQNKKKVPFQEFVTIIGSASRADRTYVYQYTSDENEDPVLEEIALHQSEFICRKTEKPVFSGLSFREFSKIWEPVLSEKNYISGKINSFPSAVKESFIVSKIKAILILPIFVNGKAWGFIGFDNCKDDREWSGAEEKYLKTAAMSLRNKISLRENVENLAKSEERYKLLSNLTFEGIVIHKQGIGIEVNTAFCKMTGYDETELLGENLIRKVIHKDDIRKIHQNVNKSFAEPYEVRAVRKDGSTFPAEIEAKDFHYKGKTIRVAAVRNISERKRNQKNLQESEEKFRKFMDYSSGLVRITDENFKLSFANKNHEKILGTNIDNVLGKPIWEFIYNTLSDEQKKDFTKELIKKRFIAFLENTPDDQAVTNELSYRIKNGELKHFSETVFKIKTQKGTQIGSIVTDISDLKRNEQKLKELNETKDKFFSIIAHDLRSPFNGILGFSEFLIKRHKSLDAEKQGKILKDLHSSAKKTYRLLENLLTWSRVQRNTIEFNPEKINLQSAIKENLMLMQETASQKRITIREQVEANLQIYSDPNMFNTIIRNLVSNAVKFTPTGGEINVQAQTYKADNKQVLISVADNGMGMEESEIKKLFSLEKNNTKVGTENESGSGLGLILCQEFIKRHKGKIWAESKKERGSIFYFTLPKS